MFGESQQEVINSTYILTVPKDIDALMSVSFGMASAALTTKRSANLLKSIDIKQYQMLQLLGISKEILQPVIVTINDLDKEDRTLIMLLEQMGNTADGKKKLNMLGLERFRKLTASETKRLMP